MFEGRYSQFVKMKTTFVIVVKLLYQINRVMWTIRGTKNNIYRTEVIDSDGHWRVMGPPIVCIITSEHIGKKFQRQCKELPEGGRGKIMRTSREK